MNNRNHQKQEKHFIVDILFVLALFGVFAVSALALVTIGADVYQHTVEDMGVNYESRTAVSYIMEKVRQNDTADSIFLTDLENVPALCMLSEIDEETYCPYLYKRTFYAGRSFPRRTGIACRYGYYGLAGVLLILCVGRSDPDIPENRLRRGPYFLYPRAL